MMEKYLPDTVLRAQPSLGENVLRQYPDNEDEESTKLN